MGPKRPTAARAVAKLREAGVELPEGQALLEMARKLQIAEQVARLRRLAADRGPGNN
jgi:hypothetical protein